jgi:hypothetical protein
MMRQPIRLFSLLLAAALLGACVELPRPFAHRGPVMENALIELPSGDGVRVELADGLDPAIADPLRKAAVKALSDAGIPASSEATLQSGYVLTGAVQLDESQDGGSETARFVWQLTGRDGLALGAFDKEVSGEVSGKRPGGLERDPAVIDAVARDVSTQVAALLLVRTGMASQTEPAQPDRVDGPTEAAQPAAPASEATLFFDGVTGAPGDGDESLTRAMNSFLKRSGVPLAPSADQAAFVLAGAVRAVPKDAGISEVNIDWHLTDRAGKSAGTISQKNPVRTAMIDKRWGELAHIVAGAAGEGVLDAFDAASAPPVPDLGKKLEQPQKSPQESLQGSPQKSSGAQSKAASK